MRVVTLSRYSIGQAGHRYWIPWSERYVLKAWGLEFENQTMWTVYSYSAKTDAVSLVHDELGAEPRGKRPRCDNTTRLFAFGRRGDIKNRMMQGSRPSQDTEGRVCSVLCSFHTG